MATPLTTVPLQPAREHDGSVGKHVGTIVEDVEVIVVVGGNETDVVAVTH